MSLPLRHLAAIRARLLGDAAIVALVGDRVYSAFIADVAEPLYPCVTLAQTAAQRTAWRSPHTYQAIYVQVDCFSKGSRPIQGAERGGAAEVSVLAERIVDLLHHQKVAVSTAECCVHEIRQIDETSGYWDPELSAWRQSSRYLIRASYAP